MSDTENLKVRVPRPWDDEPEPARAFKFGMRGQIAIITAAAVALFVGVRLLPTGSNLNHMDFRMTGKGVLDFCDPANPQFIPVVQVRSPVVLSLTSDQPPVVNKPVNFTLTM